MDAQHVRRAQEFPVVQVRPRQRQHVAVIVV
jgi:hypothetical protein